MSGSDHNILEQAALGIIRYCWEIIGYCIVILTGCFQRLWSQSWPSIWIIEIFKLLPILQKSTPPPHLFLSGLQNISFKFITFMSSFYWAKFIITLPCSSFYDRYCLKKLKIDNVKTLHPPTNMVFYSPFCPTRLGRRRRKKLYWISMKIIVLFHGDWNGNSLGGGDPEVLWKR